MACQRDGLAGAGVRLNNGLLCWGSLNSFLIDLTEAIGGDRSIFGFTADRCPPMTHTKFPEE
jgi:hypothetical protein